MSIYVTRSSMPDYEYYIKEIKPIYENPHLTNTGPGYRLSHIPI